MKVKDLLKKFDIEEMDLPEIILEYEASDYKEHHIENMYGREFHVFSAEDNDGILIEGILDTNKPAFRETIKLPGNVVGQSIGGVVGNSYII